MSASTLWPTPANLRWLESVLHERIASGLRLQQEQGYLRVTHVAAEGSIRIPSAPAFSGRQLDGCAPWAVSDEGRSAAAGPNRLPAPGLNHIEGPLITRNGTGYSINYDIPGLTYWMLSRCEEVKAQRFDVFGRFPAGDSHAFRHGYLHRPIVDEWLDVLRQVMQRLWPQLPFAQRTFEVKVSHDVDVPSRYGFASLTRLGRHIAADLLKRRDLRGALQAARIRMNTRGALLGNDPMNTFDWLMDQSEERGLKSAFYFICGRTDRKRDADYDLEHPAIRKLLRRIHERGHEIGLHPSFNTYLDAGKLALEARHLRSICAEEGIRQTEWGGRMHYLRWRHPVTLNAWNEAGMTYDSTLGYAEAPGFRCGTCIEYPAFDPVADRPLTLRIRPLIAMETSIMSPQYLGLGNGPEALAKLRALKNACRDAGGTFTLLWHNSSLQTPEDKALYCAVLDDARPNS